jgi:hypothetical protein
VRSPTRRVRVRIDDDVIEVDASRRSRSAKERHEVAEGEDRFDVLDRTIRSSRLLRPGRRCEFGVLVESPRILYPVTEDGPGVEDGRVKVVLPEMVRDVLEPIVARRRVHGPAWFAAGPALRAVDTIERRAAVGPIGRGIIVDRSSAAVTVLLVDAARIRWARGAPADDPADVAAVLLRRLGEVISGRYGIHWWHLEDVARPSDERRGCRELRGLEARCHALIGYLPRMAVRS